MSHTQPQAPTRNLHLGSDRVQAIDHIVKLAHVDPIRILRQVKHPVGRHPASGIDVTHTLGSNVHLSAPNRAVQRIDLAVDVRHTHRVVINQVKRPHPTTGQRLDHITTHATDAEHRHTAPRQAFHRRRPQQQLRPGKRTLHSSHPLILHFAHIIIILF